MSNVNTRDEIINTAQKLFFTVGYDKTSIQMILNELNIAKGTFYHYFKSKSELVVEIVKIFSEKAIETFHQINNSSLSPIEKLNTLFNTSGKYKAANIDNMKPVMFALYNDNNLVLREKMKRQNLELVAPLLDTIIEEGMNTGDFKCKHKNLGEIIMVIGTAISDKFCFSIINTKKSANNDLLIDKTVNDMKMYTYTIETILGVEPGKLSLFDENLTRELLQKLM